MKKKLVIILLAAASYGLVNAQNITGTGTNGTIPKFTGTSTEGNSQIIDNGTTIGIGGGTIPGTNSPKLYSYGPGAYFDIPNIVGYQGNGKAMFKINRPSTSFENFLSFCEGGANKWAIGMDDEASGSFYISGNPAGTVMTLTTSGNVGIGTTSPSTKLHVAGSMTLDGTIKFPTLSNVDLGGGTSANYSVLLRDNNNQLVRTSFSSILSTMYAVGPYDPDPSLCPALWDPTNCTSSFTTTPTWSNVAGAGILYANCANVGIGTSTPIYTLDVSGSSRIVGNLGVGIAPSCTTKVSVHANNNSDPFLKFDNTAGTQFTMDHSGNPVFGNPTTLFCTSIGQAPNLDYGNTYLGFNVTHDPANNWWGRQTNGAANGGSLIWGSVNGQLSFSSLPNWNGSQSIPNLSDAQVVSYRVARMRFDLTYGPQMMIGETMPGTHPDFMLSVAGKVVAKEIYVTNTSWADYVFDNDYKLMSLDSLENYITANKHLPNVPTTQEVMANGNNTGETDRILLEKVEELTLYIIQLEKRLKELEGK
jgi:hypothetical protein